MRPVVIVSGGLRYAATPGDFLRSLRDRIAVDVLANSFARRRHSLRWLL